MTTIEEKIVFGISPDGQGDGIPLVLLGIPKGAWKYMKDGKTHNLDLTKVGIPAKIILYGGDSHTHCMKMIEGHLSGDGLPYLDRRREDFSIKDKEEP